MSQPPALSVYGKLPLSKEFLRLRCSGGAPWALYQWINAGFDMSVASQNDGGKSLPLGTRWRLVFCADGIPEVAVAVIRDSTDHGGLRHFPFSCFSVVGRAKLPESAAEALASLGLLWEQLGQAEVKLSQNVELDQFKAEVRDWPLTFDGKKANAHALWSSYPLEPIIRSIGASIAPTGDPSRLFTNLCHEMADAVRVLDSKRIPGAKLPALRLPVAEGADTLAQASAWLACISSCDFIRNRKSPVTVAIPEGVTGQGSAWLVIRPPRPADYGIFGAGVDGFFHPDPGGRMAKVEEEPFTAFAERLKIALLKDGATLADLAEFRLV